jgi:hypothetical protein
VYGVGAILAQISHRNRWGTEVMNIRFYLGRFVNTEGGMWIVLMDALLLVPLIMAAFFYPWPSLLAGLGLLAASVAGYEGWAIWQRRHHH